MLLVDAIFIHNGGGKVLLDYLVEHLEQSEIQVYYLFDDRIKNISYQIKQSNHSLYLPASLIKRDKFYRKNKILFSKVFILGNIPPLCRIDAQVITYFHNLIYLSVPKEFNFIEQVKFRLKIAVLKLFKLNTDVWVVQSEKVKKQFIEKFDEFNKVEIISFYPEIQSESQIEREKGRLIYVSNAQANKNHRRLIDAFCKAYDEIKKGKLILTVNDDFQEIVGIIKKAQDEGYPIINLGYIDRADLADEYLRAEYVIFPSLSESLGLGIIEGITMGCKIIGANLPYTFAVCNPSLTFEPQDIDSIKSSIITAIEKENPFSSLKVENKMDLLMKLLIE